MKIVVVKATANNSNQKGEQLEAKLLDSPAKPAIRLFFMCIVAVYSS